MFYFSLGTDSALSRQAQTLLEKLATAGPVGQPNSRHTMPGLAATLLSFEGLRDVVAMRDIIPAFPDDMPHSGEQHRDESVALRDTILLVLVDKPGFPADADGIFFGIVSLGCIMILGAVATRSERDEMTTLTTRCLRSDGLTFLMKQTIRSLASGSGYDELKFAAWALVLPE